MRYSPETASLATAIVCGGAVAAESDASTLRLLQEHLTKWETPTIDLGCNHVAVACRTNRSQRVGGNRDETLQIGC